MDRTCVTCGASLANRGRTAKQCGECVRGRRRVKERRATCADCGIEFVPPGQTGQSPKRCEPCNAAHRRRRGTERQKAWRDANPDRAREQWNKYNRKRLADPEHLRQKREDAMRRAYGLSEDDYQTLLAAQSGVCAICAGPPNGPGKRLHVDHCHNSDRVRGLLCAKCNTAVGLLDDDYGRIRDAADYVRYGGLVVAAHRRWLTLAQEYRPDAKGRRSKKATAEIDAAVDEVRRLRQEVPVFM